MNDKNMLDERLIMNEWLKINWRPSQEDPA